uniref:Ovule protein n=1 Tax=Panagrellus redivivus TaxID=6233 RepID=A0A7E4WA10_PANRE
MVEKSASHSSHSSLTDESLHDESPPASPLPPPMPTDVMKAIKVVPVGGQDCLQMPESKGMDEPNEKTKSLLTMTTWRSCCRDGNGDGAAVYVFDSIQICVIFEDCLIFGL